MLCTTTHSRLIAALRAQLHTLRADNKQLLARQRMRRSSSSSSSSAAPTTTTIAASAAAEPRLVANAERDGPAQRRRGPVPEGHARHAPQQMGAIEWVKPPCVHDELLRQQLGYVPPNLIDVAAWHPDGRGTPAVVLLYPLKSDPHAHKAKERTTAEPFPTMYWLTCPELSAAVSKLEAVRWVEKLQERVNSSDEYREIVAAQHAAYAAARWALLTPADEELALARRWEKALRYKGIAGLNKFDRVKCLHAHYAHFLGSGGQNLVGQWVAELLIEQEAQEARIGQELHQEQES